MDLMPMGKVDNLDVISVTYLNSAAITIPAQTNQKVDNLAPTTVVDLTDYNLVGTVWTGGASSATNFVIPVNVSAVSQSMYVYNPKSTSVTMPANTIGMINRYIRKKTT